MQHPLSQRVHLEQLVHKLWVCQKVQREVRTWVLETRAHKGWGLELKARAPSEDSGVSILMKINALLEETIRRDIRLSRM
jgi:hypothetical protein